jgi:hypothetical protein
VRLPAEPCLVEPARKGDAFSCIRNASIRDCVRGELNAVCASKGYRGVPGAKRWKSDGCPQNAVALAGRGGRCAVCLVSGTLGQNACAQVALSAAIATMASRARGVLMLHLRFARAEEASGMSVLPLPPVSPCTLGPACSPTPLDRARCADIAALQMGSLVLCRTNRFPACVRILRPRYSPVLPFNTSPHPKATTPSQPLLESRSISYSASAKRKNGGCQTNASQLSVIARP